ncbi:hypothetical protein N9L68_00810 [bacterium]|nr:hypothetical protein [bacterium]
MCRPARSLWRSPRPACRGMAHSLDNAVIDTCDYPDNQSPDVRLGRIWARWGIPHEQRVALSRNIKTIGHMSNLASNVADFESRIQTPLTAVGLWPSSPSDQVIAETHWGAV